MAVIETHHLTREHAPGRGVRDVTMSVQTGQCVGLLGVNGSGKTTLVHVLLGLQKADSGRASVCGAVPGSAPARGGCAAALDTAGFWENLSGRTHAIFAARQYGLSRDDAAQQADRWLEIASLANVADAPVGTYSFGMRRKLSIVAAMIADPQLLVLDEPTAGVDGAFAAALADCVRNRSSRGRTTLLAGNDADWLADVVDRAVVLTDGCVVAEGSADQLLDEVRSRDEIAIELAAARQISTDANVPGMVSLVAEGQRVTAVVDSAPAALGPLAAHLAAAGATIKHVDVRTASLADVVLLHSHRENPA